MAQRAIITFVDDLDDSEFKRGSGETIRFGVNGREDEIDLSDDNATALRRASQPCTEAGRCVVTPGSRRRRSERSLG